MNATSPIQSLDQRRAEYAWRAAEIGVRGQGKAYVNLVKGASTFIMGNGLMQAMAFYQSRVKKEAEAQSLLKNILGWLGESKVVPDLRHVEFEAAMNSLFKTDSHHYMRATRETLSMLRWLRQFADALQATSDVA